MDRISLEVIQVLQYLLPGFLAAWVFYGLTSFAKPSQFERTVQALIFTILVQSLVYLEKAAYLSLCGSCSMTNWTDTTTLISSTLSAILLGVTFSFFANNDKLHALLRWALVTRETSYPSEWFGAFLNNVTYVVLHLEGERRIYGWVVEWPSEPTSGHFLLEQASWIDDSKDIPLSGVASIMINVKSVIWVEFMEKTWERKDEQEGVKPTTP